MTNLTRLFAGLVLVFGLVTVSNAASVVPATDGFKVFQSDTSEDEEKKIKEGEEEEPDC